MNMSMIKGEVPASQSPPILNWAGAPCALRRMEIEMTLEQILVTGLNWLMQLSNAEFLGCAVALNFTALISGLGIGKMTNLLRGL